MLIVGVYVSGIVFTMIWWVTVRIKSYDIFIKINFAPNSPYEIQNFPITTNTGEPLGESLVKADLISVSNVLSSNLGLLMVFLLF